MNIRSYRAAVEALASVRSQDDAPKARMYSIHLLEWIWIRALVGTPAEPAREWYRTLLGADADTRPIAEFNRLAALVAAAALLGEEPGEPLARALKQVPSEAAVNELLADTQAVVTQTIAALYAFAGDNDNGQVWLGRRLRQELHEGWESSGFEVMYSCSNYSADEDLDDLILAAVRASVEALQSFANPLTSVVLSAARQSAGRGGRLDQQVAGRLNTLDRAVFGAGDKPALSFKRTRVSATARGLEVGVRVDGEGVLTTGGYEVEPLTTHFCARAAALLRRRPELVDRLDTKTDAVIATLQLPASVSVPSGQLRNLTNRLRLAIDHCRSYEGLLAAPPTVAVEVAPVKAD